MKIKVYIEKARKPIWIEVSEQQFSEIYVLIQSRMDYKHWKIAMNRVHYEYNSKFYKIYKYLTSLEYKIDKHINLQLEKIL